MLLHTDPAGFTKIMTIATSKYIMVCEACEWLLKKNFDTNYDNLLLKISVVNECFDSLCSWFMNRYNDNKVMKAL